MVAHRIELDELLFSSFFVDHGNNNEQQKLSSNLTCIDIDMSSATVNTELSVSYPSGFNRSNSVAIGIAGYDKNYGVWYGYLNNNNIIITLATNIIVQTVSASLVGVGAKIRVVLMKIGK